MQGIADGLLYMGHTNNNFIGAGHPYAGVWDNGSNLVDHLKHEIRVRNIGLAGFGETMIRTGQPLSDLHYVLLPLYMHHRFPAARRGAEPGRGQLQLRAQGRRADAVRDCPPPRSSATRWRRYCRR